MGASLCQSATQLADPLTPGAVHGGKAAQRDFRIGCRELSTGALLITEGPIHCLDDRLPDLCPHVPLAQPHEPVPVEAFDLPHDLAQMYGVNRPMLFGGEEIKEEYLIEALAA